MNIDFLIGLGIDETTAKTIIETFEAEIDTALAKRDEERLKDKYAYAKTSALLRAGAKNACAAGAVLDFEWDGEDFDGEPAGLDDAIESLRNSMPYLFGSDKDNEATVYTFVGISPAEESDAETSPGELSYSEYMRLYRN